MDPQWLLTENFWLRILAFAAMSLPAVFILFSRRSRGFAKLVWFLSSLLAWAFIAAFVWVWRERYSPSELPPLADAMGWWMLAFPWAIYLLYRATRARYPGERRPPG